MIQLEQSCLSDFPWLVFFSTFGSIHKKSIMISLRNICIALFISTAFLPAQKNDFIWMSGYGGGLGSNKYGLTILDFHSGNPVISYNTEKNIYLESTNAGISNAAGELRYYTNGDILLDKNLELVPGGQDLSRVDKEGGIPIDQCAMILDYPDRPESYIVFYPYDTTYRIDTFGGGVSFLSLRYMMVDYNSLTKETRVSQKHSFAIRDTINAGGFTACRHANGRDWWILIPERSPATGIYKILLDPEGLHVVDKQIMPTYIRNGVCVSSFSSDGNYFAFLSSVGRETGSFLYLFKFNRCNGNLDLTLNKNYYERGLFNGIYFSPNSKYLYHGHSFKIYQLDLQAPDIMNSAILLDTIDPVPRLGMSWSFFKNGPDGRLYSGTGYGQPYLHVIEKPNLRGLNCIPRRMGIPLQVRNNSTPNFPHFRLGPIDGSDCDTLGIDNVPWAWWRYDQDTGRYRCFEFVDLSAYIPSESAPEWYWDLGDGTQSRDPSPVHCYQKDGVYEVCLIVKNKYGADTLCRTLRVGTTSTDDQGKVLISTELFPNPAADHFVLNVHDYLPESMYLHLVNSQGQTVLHHRVYQGSNVIELQDLKSGLYSVLIYERGVLMKTEKLAVVRE